MCLGVVLLHRLAPAALPAALPAACSILSPRLCARLAHLGGSPGPTTSSPPTGSLANKHDWYGRFKIAIGTGDSLKGDYSEQLARSKFCLVAPGGWRGGWVVRACLLA